MHIEFASLVGECLKFQELELHAKRRVLHFKSPRAFPVWAKLMDYPVEPIFVSFGIGGFKLPTSVVFIFQFQHFRSHPLLDNVGLDIRSEK